MTTTFKTSTNTSVAKAKYAPPPKEGDGSTTQKSEVEVPYTSYQNEHKMPFSAKYLGVESTWNEGEMADDIQTIEEYLGGLVNTGELKDETDTVKKKLKSIEKMANIDQMESNGLRIIKLSSFIKYLRHLDGRKNDTN